jgi:hypothetical protein
MAHYTCEIRDLCDVGHQLTKEEQEFILKSVAKQTQSSKPFRLKR